MNAINVDNLVKRFDKITVLNVVTTTFEQEKIHGIIGRNGSDWG